MNMVLALAPLIALQLVLAVAALIDISRREAVTGGNKLPWALVIIFVGAVGPIVYFIFGRKETVERDRD